MFIYCISVSAKLSDRLRAVGNSRYGSFTADPTVRFEALQ